MFLKKIGRKTKKFRNKNRAHAYRISNKLCEELRVNPISFPLHQIANIWWEV
jgi:hypothetical protein